jgi:DNA-binding GntR family transcriptional regulator
MDSRLWRTVCYSLTIGNVPIFQNGEVIVSEPRRASASGAALNLPLRGPAARTSLGEVVAERLREAILNDELSPGQHLREEGISEMLDTSRGPVRDAFLILEREGLVRLSRHRGATVVELSLEDLGEVYSLRSAIEGLAIRLAIRRHEPADLAAMDDSVADLQTAMKRKITEQRAARLDVNFHDCIFAAAHHDRLYKSWSNIRMQVYWFLLSRNVASSDWRGSMADGHKRILDLIRAGNEEAAVGAVGEHIKAAYTRICTSLAERNSTSSAGEPGDTFLLG